MAIATLFRIATPAVQGNPRQTGLWVLAVVLLLLLAYGLVFLDLRLGLWSHVGLDYSTHTAVSLVLALFLSSSWPRLGTLWRGSWVAYILLMSYQRYHTLADIAVTAFAVGIPAWWLLAILRRKAG